MILSVSRIHLFNFYLTGKPDVKWFRNKEEIKDSEDFKYENAGDVFKLVITEVFPEDGGIYVCEATNSAATASSNFTINVEGKWYQDLYSDRIENL